MDLSVSLDWNSLQISQHLLSPLTMKTKKSGLKLFPRTYTNNTTWCKCNHGVCATFPPRATGNSCRWLLCCYGADSRDWILSSMRQFYLHFLKSCSSNNCRKGFWWKINMMASMSTVKLLFNMQSKGLCITLTLLQINWPVWKDGYSHSRWGCARVNLKICRFIGKSNQWILRK